MITSRATPKFLMAFLISAALHGAVSMALFVEMPAASHLLHPPAQRNFAPPPKSIMMELVPAPKHLKEEKIPEKASVVSDMASRAQNPDSKPDLPKKDPYQNGEAEHHSIERVLLPPGTFKAQNQSASSAAQPEKPKIRDLLKELEEKPKPQPPPVKKADLKKTKYAPKTRGEITIQTKLKNNKNKIAPKKKTPVEPAPEKVNSSTPAQPQQTAVKASAPGLPLKQDDFASAGKKNLTSAAEILDEIAYNSQSNAVSKYLAPELKKVANVWQLKLYSLTDFSGGLLLDVRRTGIIFKIMPSGEVQNLRVVEHDGNEFTERYPLEAVEKVSPFTPLPPDVISYIRTDGLWVKIEFNYTGKRKAKKQ